MAHEPSSFLAVQARREALGWSQAELARRAGISRAAVSAVETGRVSPSVTAALALARALGGTVEELFGVPGDGAAGGGGPCWAWEPARYPSRLWRADVGGRTVHYPATGSAVPHDGVAESRETQAVHQREAAASTLVVAGCDPAFGLLRAELAELRDVRLLPLPASSGRALDWLREGLVHAAGLHLNDGDPEGNMREVAQRLGPGYVLLRLSRWHSGVALAPGLGVRSVRQAVRGRLRWILRDEGSGAQRCLRTVFAEAERKPPRDATCAPDHAGVAQAIRLGFVQAGVCTRLVAEEANLEFLPVRQEYFDLCYPATLEGDPRIRALVAAVQGGSFRTRLSQLPGYDASTTGDRHTVEASLPESPTM